MLAVAVVGLAVNLGSMKLLAAGSSESLNVKGAYFEVMSDMLGSVGVIIAALIVMFTGWRLADPIIGAGIGLLHRAAHLVIDEAGDPYPDGGTPPEIDLVLLEGTIKEDPGVVAVHDLHVWTITSGLDATSCHVVIADMARARETLRAGQRSDEGEVQPDAHDHPDRGPGAARRRRAPRTSREAARLCREREARPANIGFPRCYSQVTHENRHRPTISRQHGGIENSR